MLEFFIQSGVPVRLSTCWLSIAIFLALALLCGSTATAATTVHFVGPDFTHVAYKVETGDIRQFRVKDPEGLWSVLAESNEGNLLEGTLRHETPEPGLYRYQARYKDGGDWIEQEYCEVLVEGDIANGTLKFDETLRDAGIRQVILGEDILLTLDGKVFGADPLTNDLCVVQIPSPKTIMVRDTGATLVVTDGMMVTNVTLQFHQPFSFYGSADEHSGRNSTQLDLLEFHPGSGGSELENFDVNGIMSWTDLTLSGFISGWPDFESGSPNVFRLPATVSAFGNLSFLWPTIIRPEVSIILNKADGYSGLEGGSFVLLEEGTTFTHCDSLYVDPRRGVRLSSVTNCTVFLGRTDLQDPGGPDENMTVSVRNSHVTMSGTARRGLYVLRDSTLIGTPVIQDAADWDIENVEFVGTLQVGRPAGTPSDPLFTGRFRAVDTRFEGFSAHRTAPDAVEIVNGLFSGIVTVFGGGPSFTGCEFGTRLNLANRSAVSIQNSLFMQGLRFYSLAADSPLNHADTPPWYETGASPTINGNDFVGDVALLYHRQVGEDDEITSPINIGANYYGDANGPLIDQSSGFLGYYGGHGGGRVISAIGSLPALASNVFSLASAKTGPSTVKRKDTRVPPRFWLNGSIAGQGTLTHSSAAMTFNDPNRLKGRETLLSLDLMTTDEDLRGVQIYAEWNGQRIYANGPKRLYRDRSRFSPAQIQNGHATADFILPGVQEDSMTVRVYVDASGAGFENAPGKMLLMSTPLTFADPPARPLRIGVAPVWLVGYGQGDASPVTALLRSQLPAMLPLPSDRLEVVELPRVTVPALGGLFSSATTVTAVAGKIAASDWLHGKTGGQRLDFIVAVLPSAFIGEHNDGVNLRGFRRILFVDAGKPSAVVHELGHGMGLYRETEQYDSYPENGLPVSLETMFATEGKLSKTRFEHIPGPHYAWYKGPCYFDVMGNSDRLWPIRQTREEFGNWIRAHLGLASGASSFPVATSVRAGYTTLGTTSRILISGGVRATATNPDRYEFVPGTLTGFDVSGETPPSTPPAATGLWYHKHRFIAYDAQGGLLGQQDFYLTEDHGPWRSWTATFELPSGTGAYAIHKVDAWGQSVAGLLSVESAGLVSNTILRPLAGAMIGEWFDAEWTYQAGAGHDPSHISHAWYYRASPAEPWAPFIAPTGETTIRHLSDILPPTDSLDLRLVTSDGLDTVETIVGGLMVEARTPRVLLHEPRPGEAGLSGQDWPLRAEVTDPDRTGIDAGTWTSSRDGILGVGPSLSVSLSPGEHTLVYTVLGNNGKAGSNCVEVTVHETMANTDLALTEARLTLHNTLIDPTGIIPEQILPGSTNSLLLQFRNPGVDATGRIKVFLQRPEGGEEEIGDDRFALTPFETAVHLFRFTASGKGTYTVRAELSEVDPADSAPGNNTREWVFTSLNPAITLNPNVLQLYRSPSGQPGEVFNTWAGTVRVENNGFTDLQVSSVTLHGEAASHFTIVQNEATAAPIPPLGSASLTLRASVPYGSARHTVLRVASDDPGQPVAEALLMAIVGAESQLEDSDEDGLMDGIERYLGSDPMQADSTGNGTNDLAELSMSLPLDEAMIRLSGSLDFGAVEIGSSAEGTLRILNLGTSPLQVTAISYPDGFSGPLLHADLLPGGGVTNLVVTFSPLAVQDYAGSILVASDATSGDNARLVSGSGVLPTVATPSFDPDGGAHAGTAVTVTLSCETPEVDIHYTTDGNDPTTDSASVANGGTVSVPLPGTLRARAWKAGMSPSPVRTSTYGLSGEPLGLDPWERLHAAGQSVTSHVVLVSGPAEWTADAELHEWIRLIDGVNGVGNGTITYVLDANPGFDRRTGQIRVHGASGTTMFNVTQIGSGALAPWGGNHEGQLDVPHDPGPFQAIAAGSSHYLALRENGTVLAWGSDGSGQSSVPAHVTNVVALAAGWYHNLALLETGNVVGWGEDSYGEASVPEGLSNVVAVAAGADHSVALRADGTVVAWGDDWSGQADVPGNLSNAVTIAAGGWHSLALKADGTVVAWGDNWSGQTDVPGNLSNVVAIAAGGWHSLALKADGTVVAWGDPWSGQLDVPEGLDQVEQIAAGVGHNLVLRSDGSIIGWGDNWSGQVEQPVDLPPVLAIAANGGSLALLSQSFAEPMTPNGIAISWLEGHDLPTDGSVDFLDPHSKGMTLLEQYIADTDPNEPDDVFRVLAIEPGPPVAVTFSPASAARVYTLQATTNLASGAWAAVPGQGPRPGTGGPDALNDDRAAPARFYRVRVEVP